MSARDFSIGWICCAATLIVCSYLFSPTPPKNVTVYTARAEDGTLYSYTANGDNPSQNDKCFAYIIKATGGKLTPSGSFHLDLQ